MKPWKVVHTFTAADVGEAIFEQGSCPHCERRYPPLSVRGLMGRVRQIDVGKQLVEVDGLLYVENQKQFEERTNGKAS